MASNTKINQTPQVLFLTEKIADPVVRHNFDILNKELLKRRKLEQPPAANMVYSNKWPVGNNPVVYNGTSELQPGPLSVTITTKGNPVLVRLAPYPYSKLGRLFPEFFMQGLTAQQVSMYGGFYRSGADGNPIVVSKFTAFGSAQNGSINFSSLTFPLPFSMFDFTDYNVPSGTWRYQFYMQPAVAGTQINLFWACVEARELR